MVIMMNILPDEGAKMDGTSISLLAYADDILLLWNNINTIKSLSEKLIAAPKKVNLQINEEKTDYIDIRRRRDGRQTEEFLKVGSYSSKKLSEFKYLGTIKQYRV
jgi:hypothetical protein